MRWCWLYGIALAAALLAGPAFAEGPDGPAGPPDEADVRQRLRDVFDFDKNGELSESEREAMRDAIRLLVRNEIRERVEGKRDRLAQVATESVPEGAPPEGAEAPEGPPPRPEGDRGPEGRRGPRGERGGPPEGRRRGPGPDGPAGEGDRGPEGRRGPRGERGPAGPPEGRGRGLRPDGPDGDRGPEGWGRGRGPEGDRGPEGRRRPDGPTGERPRRPEGPPRPDGPSDENRPRRGPDGPPDLERFGRRPLPPPPRVEVLFEWFDRNRDGQLSRGEFQELARFIQSRLFFGPPGIFHGPGDPGGEFRRRGPGPDGLPRRGPRVEDGPRGDRPRGERPPGPPPGHAVQSESGEVMELEALDQPVLGDEAMEAGDAQAQVDPQVDEEQSPGPVEQVSDFSDEFVGTVAPI